MSLLKSKLPAFILTSALLTLSPQVLSEQSSALAFSVGVFDFLDEDPVNRTAEVGIEYRAAPLKDAYDLIPVLGVNVNLDSAYWIYTGVRYDYHLNEDWVLTPSFAVSLYEDGSSKDLGYPFQFRSGLEFAYKINGSSHLGLGIYHLSNFRLADHNPGEESIILSYSFSLRRFKF